MGASSGDRWRRKASPPQFLTERHKQIWEGDGSLGAIPRAHDPAEAAILLEVRGGPEEDQAVDHSDEGDGTFDGLRCLALSLAEAEVLLGVMEGDLQCPAMRVGLEHERRVAVRLGGR